MTNYSDTNHNDAPDRNRQWISCIAKADFAGDTRCAQLSFRKNDRLEIDLRLPPQNGWRWGETESSKGWFPEWAADPLSSRVRPSTSEHQHYQPSSFYQNHHHHHSSNNNNNHHPGFGRSRDRVAPLAHISENPSNDMRIIQRPKQESSYGINGFDVDNNQIMGGQNPTTGSTSNHSDGQRKPQLRSDKNNHGSLYWKDPFAIMTKNENPYTKDQREPEWDGSEVPQIVNNVNGSVTILETDGKASSYRDERSYKLAEATNRMAEKLSSTGKALEKKVFSGFRMPAVHKPRIDNDDRLSRRKDADTSSTTTNTTSQRKIPKIPTFSKPRFGVKSRVHKTREDTIVDDRRRSSRSSRLNIGF